MVRQGSTRNPNAADWARYSAELESPVMPRWVVGAGRYQDSQTTSNAVPMYLFVYLDGSMLTYGEQDGSNFPQNNPGLKARWRRAVGIDGSKAAQNLFAVDVAGDRSALLRGPASPPRVAPGAEWDVGAAMQRHRRGRGRI